MWTSLVTAKAVVLASALLLASGCARSAGDPAGPHDAATDASGPGDASTPTDGSRDGGGPIADAATDGGLTDGPGIVVEVTSSAELRAALGSATPGTLVNVHPGTYTGQFTVGVSGLPGFPITIRGPADRSAVLDGSGGVGSWQGILTLEGRHHVTVENLEIRNAGAERYGVLVGAPSQTADGCHDVVLRNLHVHHVGEEIIKIQGRNTRDIFVEDCVVHSNLNWSGIDVQGTWGGTPPDDVKPKRVVIRRNLIYDIGGADVGAGIGNEFADQIQTYGNVILGCTMGLDIGCGNYNIVQNNLVASYAVFNDRVADPGYTAIDLSRYGAFSPSEISGFSRARCVDGIALSGNYLSLVFDNEVTDCTGDLVLSYDHGPMHNSVYGHQQNLFFRNYFHDNAAYWIIREYDKQTGGVSYDELFFNNVLAKNGASARFSFEHSVGLMLVNNTVVDNGPLALAEQSTGALIANNIFYSSSLSVAADSTGAQVATNYQGAAAILFVDYQGGDYHVAAQTGSACIDTGTNLSSALDAVFAAVAAHMGEYAFYPDFDLAFDFYRDRDGNLQDAGWDLGAYSQPR